MKKRKAGIVLLMIVLSIALIGGQIHGVQAGGKQDISNKPKNVILMVGDGMGFPQVTAAAYTKRKRGYSPGHLHMQRLTHSGNVITHSHDSVVTDSAASATAFSAGHKTDNGYLGQAPRNKRHWDHEHFYNVQTVLEAAEKRGLKTGLVTTARLTHATPAAFASHVPDRGMENEIASQMLTQDIEVLLGGGRRHFLPESEGGRRDDGRNLLKEADQKGYDVVQDRKSLRKATGEKLLGVFNDSHLTYELDRKMTREPHLKTMTKKAIRHLSKSDKGFFLMVEGGRIDHAGHANHPATNVNETLAFDQAVKEAIKFASKDQNTLVIVTADHETGGMSVGANSEYAYHKDVIRKVKRTPEYMSKKLKADGSNLEAVLARYAGIKNLKPEEKEIIRSADNTADGIAKVISDRALIGWTTDGHTALNVPIYSYGPYSNRLTGTLDNTLIAKIIFRAIGD
ncbi:alkaline phosphatase [Melghirimyces algeriensis]|uniref:Alkaline phosphatase n=1 Tax=Melghirimyces algeriensis TaxID=910412 RepID=A0A521EJ35_9BACL|nr:alkaline phosphatase [Melghirimyces algeriensis]SMO83924.1 alkaline phosphatase [Melghirimyces algeriensis]